MRSAGAGNGGGEAKLERTVAQKIERMSTEVKNGTRTIEDTLREALSDPSLASMLTQLLPAGGKGAPQSAPMARGR